MKFLRATLFLGVLFLANTAHADTTFYWTNLETGQETAIQQNGTYAVPLNVPGEIFIQIDSPVFGTEGSLFFIPDSSLPTREFVEHLGGFFGVGEIAWGQAGVYE